MNKVPCSRKQRYVRSGQQQKQNIINYAQSPIIDAAHKDLLYKHTK